MYLTTDPYPNLSQCKSAGYYDPLLSELVKIPFGLTERPTKELTVVIPAYNEETRLPIMLSETLQYLKKRKVALKFSKSEGTDVFRVVSLRKNSGKGAAVRAGILFGRGRYLLFADADGATRFSDIEKLQDSMSSLIANRWNGGMAVICGSRAHLDEEVVAKRNFFRNLLMYGFKFCVWLLCVGGIKDTQCGFKLFSRQAARKLFHNLHVERWAFDVDLLYLARHFDMTVIEVPVHWREIPGSKLVPVFSWIQMAKDLLLIRLRYSLGAWKIEPIHC